MKILRILMVVFACALLSTLEAQQNQLSVYVGAQIPSEIAFLDFGGNGPDDIFRPGFAAGLSVERNWKALGVRGDLDFTTNGMKDRINGSESLRFDGRLNNLYLRSYLQLKVLGSEGGPQLSLGAGPGLIIGSVPKSTFKIDVDGDDFVLERRTEVSLGLCSSVRLNIPISDKLAFYSALNNDFIVLYGDRETVIYTNLNLGLTFMF